MSGFSLPWSEFVREGLRWLEDQQQRQQVAVEGESFFREWDEELDRLADDED